jgi:hypothetical protein
VGGKVNLSENLKTLSTDWRCRPVGCATHPDTSVCRVPYLREKISGIYIDLVSNHEAYVGSGVQYNGVGNAMPHKRKVKHLSVPIYA